MSDDNLSDVNTQKWYCWVCGKEFTSPQECIDHTRLHEGNIK
jgi:hypothetical protein